jgi:hypothetical protein
MALRKAPFVGAHVSVLFLARRVPGTVEEITAGGRRLVVLTEEGELTAFTLRKGSGYFVEEEGPDSSGARLRFEEEP